MITSSSAFFGSDDERVSPDLFKIQTLDGLDQSSLRVDGKLILQ